MPTGVEFTSDEHYLLIYEDLQTQRTEVHRALLACELADKEVRHLERLMKRRA